MNQFTRWQCSKAVVSTAFPQGYSHTKFYNRCKFCRCRKCLLYSGKWSVEWADKPYAILVYRSDRDSTQLPRHFLQWSDVTFSPKSWIYSQAEKETTLAPSCLSAGELRSSPGWIKRLWRSSLPQRQGLAMPMEFSSNKRLPVVLPRKWIRFRALVVSPTSASISRKGSHTAVVVLLAWDTLPINRYVHRSPSV